MYLRGERKKDRLLADALDRHVVHRLDSHLLPVVVVRPVGLAVVDLGVK